MFLLVLLPPGLHEEGVRGHLAPRLVGVALPHDAAAAAAAAARPPGGSFFHSTAQWPGPTVTLLPAAPA